METGVGINPVTLRPKSFRGEQDREEKQVVEKKRLQEKAADMALLHSDEAKRFGDLIMSRLQKRIDALISDDPEAFAYMKLLSEWGHKVNAAKQATERLYAIYIREEKG